MKCKHSFISSVLISNYSFVTFSIRQKSDEREQITQQNTHVQMTKNQENFSKMMDIWCEQVAVSLDAY